MTQNSALETQNYQLQVLLMRRWICLVLLPLAAGCFNTQDKEEREPLTPARWQEMRKDDQARAKSEDEKSHGLIGPIDKATGAIWEGITRIYNWMIGDTPFEAAKALLDPTFPDRRRQAVMYLSKHEWGRKEPYVSYYEQMAKADDERLVKAIAIRALNRSRDRKATAIYIQLLENPSDLVRLEAAKALANMPDPASVDALTRHLQNPEENVDVRVACADALRNYHTIEVGRVLVGVLKDRQFGISWQARRSLMLMTGKDYRYNQTAWLDHLTGNERPFG